MSCTIAASVFVSGIGLHSGAGVEVTINPAPANSGRFFQIKFPDGEETVPASYDRVCATQLSTELKGAQVSIRTIEHLLAALWGMGITDAEICVVSPTPVVEMPILDGSAQGWTDAIAQAGIAPQESAQENMILTHTCTVSAQDSFVVAMPSDRLQFTYGIEFPSLAIGNQWFTWTPEQNAPFSKTIAPARTFTLAEFIEPMRSQGLIKGGSLENALVCDEKTWLNPPLRFNDEPCRHKLLDLIGDLSLLGHIPTAHYLAYKASHHLHSKLCHQIHAYTDRN